MEIEQRLLRRQWLLDNDVLLIRELEFHRQYFEEERREGLVLWEQDALTGSCRVV